MIQVKIKNKLSQEYTHGSEFPTLEKAQEWVSYHSSSKSFGVPEHQVLVVDTEEVPATYDEAGNEVTLKIDAITHYEVVPSEFEVEIIDITNETNDKDRAERRIERGTRRRELSQKCLDVIYSYDGSNEAVLLKAKTLIADMKFKKAKEEILLINEAVDEDINEIKKILERIIGDK